MAGSRDEDLPSAGAPLRPVHAIWLRAPGESLVDTQDGGVADVPTPERRPDQPPPRGESPDKWSTVDMDRPPSRRRWVRLVVAIGAAALLVPLGFAVLGPAPGRSNPGDSGGPMGVAQPWPADSVAGTTLPGLSFAPVEPPTAAPATPGSPSAAPTTGSPPGRNTTAPVRTGGAAGAAIGTRPPATTGPPPTSAAVTYSGLSGDGCAGTSTQNWYTHGEDGSWQTGSGGYSACGGASMAVPASGDPNADTDEYVVWWFETSPVVTGSCAVYVYVPSFAGSSGQPAYYKVLGGRTSSTVTARFTIDQTANRGRWVSAGTYPVSGAAISIHLANRGDSGVYLGAGQARVTCTA